MNRKIARPLDSQPEVDRFLSDTLQIDVSRLKRNIAARIIVCEKGVMDGTTHPTSSAITFRTKRYAKETDRIRLRNKIVEELYTQQRLGNDDKVTLGKGGAMPEKAVCGRQCFVLIGLPASGKSGIAATIAEKYGAVLLDSDLAKRKLPEYHLYPWGASLVNEESALIIFGDDDNLSFSSLYEWAVARRHNVLIPKIGAAPKDVISLCEGLKKMHYKVHLTLVHLPRFRSVERALQRFITSNRYVPLSKIFDEYANDPALTYFMLKNARPAYIDTYGVINTDVPLGSACICTDIVGNNPAALYKKVKNCLI